MVYSQTCNCAVYECTVSSLQEDEPKYREKISGTANAKSGSILARLTARSMVTGVGLCFV